MSHLFRTSPTSNFIPWEVNKPLPTDIHNLASRGFHVTTRPETRVKKKSLANFRETFPNTDQYLAEENVLLKPVVSIDKLIRQPPPFDMMIQTSIFFYFQEEREKEIEGKNSNEKGSCYRLFVGNDISRSKRLTVWQTVWMSAEWVEFRDEIPIVETIFQRSQGTRKSDGYENGLAGCPMHLTLHLHPSSWKILQRSRGHGRRFSF